MGSIRRGDVLLVRLGTGIGAEARKTRPAVVVSNDANNEVSPVITVVPVTSNVERVYPFDVRLPGMPRASKAMANQVRTVSKERVTRTVGAVSGETMAAIEDALLLHLGISR